ncbi:MAG TPA: cytochrome c oxidase subunit 3 [Planctomycetota bacterium]
MSLAHAPALATTERSFHGVEWRKLMMWLFLVTDALLFAGFLGGYAFCRLASDRPWPDRTQVFDLGFITVMTFALITSSSTMASAVLAARNGNRSATRAFLLATATIGLLFLGMQAFEWTHFIEDGGRPWENPWGVPGFSAYFFLITGFHGTHVLLGVLVLLLTATRSLRRPNAAEMVEVTGLYWHFVDLVWVFVFGCFYLI